MIMLDGCMESKLASAWPEGEISIDGKGVRETKGFSHRARRDHRENIRLSLRSL